MAVVERNRGWRAAQVAASLDATWNEEVALSASARAGRPVAEEGSPKATELLPGQSISIKPQHQIRGH